MARLLGSRVQDEAARLTDLLRITELEVCAEPIGLLTFQWF